MYQIITDTGCDFPTEMYGELQLKVVPLTVNYKGESYTTYDEPWLKDFFAGLRAGEHATTSAVNPESWKAAIEPALQEGKDALVLPFSSGLSATYQSAVIAADELREKYPDRKICVVDTLCASLGQGLLVWYACKKRDEGLSLEELTAWCEEYRYKLCHWFTVNDLHALQRGGRVSKTTAVVGSMLQIKPVLHVDDEGRLTKLGTVRGRKASIVALKDKLKAAIVNPEEQTIYISHGDCEEEARYLADLIAKEVPVKGFVFNHVGPVIGAHTGAGVIALFCVGNQR